MEKYLRKCLDSLIVSDEEMEFLEVLVINDGSKDTSLQIALEYESRFPKAFRVIDKENGNYGSCINRGLKEATGKYVKVLDADDYFDTNEFGKYINRLSKTDADLIITDFRKVDCEYKEVGIYSYKDILDEKVCYDLKQITNRLQLQMHAVTYKTDNLLRINYRQTEGISYTDQEWIFYPMAAVDKIEYFNITLYQYLVGREGQTMDVKIRQKSFGAEITIFKRMLEYYNNQDKNVIYYDYLTNFIQGRIRNIYENILFGGINCDLNEFDMYLKQYCDYEWLDNISSFSKYKIVKEFRKYRNVKALKKSLKYKLVLFYLTLKRRNKN